MTPNIVLFDVDNTLADMDHRLHYLDRENINWDEFESQAVYDPPIIPTITCARAWKALGKQIWVWTGRSENIRSVTEVWLRNNGVPFEQLLMRPKDEADSGRPTSLMKLQWLTQGPVPQDRVICAYDDDPQVIKVLIEKGKLHVYQVKRPT